MESWQYVEVVTYRLTCETGQLPLNISSAGVQMGIRAVSFCRSAKVVQRVTTHACTLDRATVHKWAGSQQIISDDNGSLL